MVKIVAIGRGETGRPGTNHKTKAIDEEIVRLSGKNNPNVLFIPPPSDPLDQEEYFGVIKKVFKRFGCDVSPLYLNNSEPKFEELEEVILGSDIIYVGGGNTFEMLTY